MPPYLKLVFMGLYKFPTIMYDTSCGNFTMYNVYCLPFAVVPEHGAEDTV